MGVLKILWRNKHIVVIFLTPIILLPLALAESQISKCAFGLLLMAVYWITESLPLSATALLPLFIFPALGVEKTSIIAVKYLKDSSFMFMGGLGVALCVEYWNLHKRVALRVLLLMGSAVRWVMLGLMVTTAFLSMWISNTATTAMMTPIAQAVFYQIWSIRRKHDIEMTRSNEGKGEEEAALDSYKTTSVNADRSDNDDDDDKTVKLEQLDPESRKLVLALTLCVCYAATCGGIATLTGTGPNIIMKGMADEISDGRSGVTFTSWMIFGAPIAYLNVFLCWIWLQIHFFGLRTFFGCTKMDNKKSMQAIKEMFVEEYEKLGPISFAEKAVLGHFITLVLLWLTYDSEFFPGWGTIFKRGYPSNAMASILVITVMLLFPSKNPFTKKKEYAFHDDVNKEKSTLNENDEDAKGTTPEKSSYERLMTWDVLQARMPWGMIFLVGGGYALAHACTVSGLSQWIGDQLTVLEGLPISVIALLLSFFISFVTEMTSNSATTAITLPIITNMAKKMGVNPLYFMLPTVISCSFAFMLPVATPPNAIAFSYGMVRVIDMAKAGVVLNMMSVLVVTLALNVWGIPLFDLHNMPEWAVNFAANSTAMNNTLISPM